jgi:hypothetical protein
MREARRKRLPSKQRLGIAVTDLRGAMYGVTEIRTRSRLPGSSGRRERYFMPLYM